MTEEHELVLMALKEGKVMLGKLNLADSRYFFKLNFIIKNFG